MMMSFTGVTLCFIFLKKAVAFLCDAIMEIISFSLNTKSPFAIYASSSRSIVHTRTLQCSFEIISFTDMFTSGLPSGRRNFRSSTLPFENVSILIADEKLIIRDISLAAANSGFCMLQQCIDPDIFGNRKLLHRHRASMQRNRFQLDTAIKDAVQGVIVK